MSGPYSCRNKTTEDVRKDAVEHSMEAKSKEFVEKAAEIYLKA